MKAYKKNKIITLLMCVISFLLVFTLISCDNAHEDKPYGSTVDKNDNSGANPYSDLDESEIVSLNLSVSLSYSSSDNMVTAYINAYDQNGDFVDVMYPDNFSVKMNSIIISSAFRTLDIQTSNINLVGLILDSSGSMAGQRLADCKSAAKLFVDTMSGSDQTAVIDFDSDARITHQLSSDKVSLKAAIDDLEAAGGTNIGGGIIQCVDAVGTRPGKTAGILLTDGADGGGLIDDGIARAQAIDMPIYSIFMGSDIDDTIRADMTKIADETGGTFYEVTAASELQHVFSSVIPSELAARPARRSYVMTFENLFSPYSNVDVLFTLTYMNAWGLHTTDFLATYYIDPNAQ